MEIEKYIAIVKLLQKEGISENIICRILEEYGKDLRTNAMEDGKNKRTGSYIVSETTQTSQPVSPNKEIKATKQVITEEKPYKMKDVQWDILVKISNTEKGKEYLESKDYYAPEDLYDLTPQQAYKLINEAPKSKKGGN